MHRAIWSVAGDKTRKLQSRSELADPDAPTTIMTITHTNTISITITNPIITISVTITDTITVTITVARSFPPTRHRRRGGNRVFEAFGS